MSIETNTILRGDCIKLLQGFPDQCVDTVITDPPYCSGGVSEASRSGAKGQGLRSENIKKMGWFVGDNMTTAGLVFLLRTMAFEALRICKPSASMLMFLDWRMAPTLIPAVESAGWRYQNLIVWDKGSMGLGNGFRAQHEMIMHMTAGSPEYYDLGVSNVIKCGRVHGEDRVHQTEKPVALIAQLLKVCCPPGGLVLDPFAGSCTTAEAAVSTGRNFICLEREGAHVEAGNDRLRIWRGADAPLEMQTALI